MTQSVIKRWIIFWIHVFEIGIKNTVAQYLNPDNSTVELPEDKIKDYFGEHAVYIVGYDQEKEMFLCKNSFGTEWGDRGYFWMPYDYAKTEVFEAWVFDIVVK